MTSSIEPWQKQFKNQLKLFEAIKSSTQVLRFGRQYVIPSDIGSQFYCEQKLEEEYLTGKIVTDEMLQGDEGHAKIVEDFSPVTMEEAWKHIFTEDKYILAEFIFIAPYKNTYIVGRPDIVLFIGGNPILLFEFKFSKYDTDFLGRHAQAQSYGLIMREIGFDIKNLFYSIVVFKPEIFKQEKFIKSTPNIIIKDFLNGDFADLEENSKSYGEVKSYIHKFDGNKAEKHVDWAIEYWTGKREPCCTEEKGKCLNCEYTQNCRKFVV